MKAWTNNNQKCEDETIKKQGYTCKNNDGRKGSTSNHNRSHVNVSNNVSMHDLDHNVDFKIFIQGFKTNNEILEGCVNHTVVDANSLIADIDNVKSAMVTAT